MILNLQEVARGVGASAHPPGLAVGGWSVDTRTQNRGDVYFALRGPNHDGHDFLTAAMEKGAAALVVEAGGIRLRASLGLAGESACPTLQLIVSDTERALQDLASWARKKWGGVVIGVTGSAGKTTTKDAIAHLLETEFPTGKTNGNFNNHVGVPLSLLRLPDDCRAGVIEMGMNHAGEIRRLAEIAKPDIAVVTNAGYAHVEFFDSIDGIAAAKRELIEALLAAIAVAHVFEIAPERLRPAVAGFTVGNMRGERTVHRGIVIWNDCYNSNPEAAQSMLDVLRETPAARRIAVLGEMLELGLAGEELHRQVGRYAGRW